MSRLYISGPVTGIEHDNVTNFRRAQRLLDYAWYEAFVPHDIVEPNDNHRTAMLLCINELTGRTQKPGVRHPAPRYDGLALLEGWEASDGARLEKAVAEACGIECRPLADWLGESDAD